MSENHEDLRGSFISFRVTDQIKHAFNKKTQKGRLRSAILRKIIEAYLEDRLEIRIK